MTHEESVQRHPAMRRQQMDSDLVRFVARESQWWDSDLIEDDEEES